MISSKRKSQEILIKLLSHVLIILFGLVMIYPVAWLLVSSFKEGQLIFSDPSLIPRAVTLSHYEEGWAGIGHIHFSTFFRNSLFDKNYFF